jgi:hypothetical protein
MWWRVKQQYGRMDFPETHQGGTNGRHTKEKEQRPSPRKKLFFGKTCKLIKAPIICPENVTAASF